jgi:hypothetical protein
MYAQQGRELEGGSPIAGLEPKEPLAKHKGVRREAESEGSGRQTSGLTNRNRIEGAVGG